MQHEDITSRIAIDLLVIDCGRKEGILGQPFLVDHSATMNAETGEITFKIEDRTISTSHLRSNTQDDRSISGISLVKEKPDKKQGQTQKTELELYHRFHYHFYRKYWSIFSRMRRK